MSKIKLLKPEVSALIAAGEVVERPLSVAKELIENSIDAGASCITVEIKNGGISFLRITDNGEGFLEEDVPTAFLRHSTSKIYNKDDLESIKTLGFRGEALHSITAVSHFEMMTKNQNAENGIFVKVSAGEISQIVPIGCPLGTTITVRDLFFNTPARMKFLKKDSTEAGYIEDFVKKMALCRNDVSFKMITNGKEVLFTPGDGNLKNALFSVFGKDIANAMVEARHQGDGVKVYGMVGKKELSRPNRNMQIFFVNGRCVINKCMYAALAEAYKTSIMIGKFPAAVLNIEINPALCDVNVHPSKAEIKFANDKPVFDGVYWAAKTALSEQNEKREFVIPSESTRKPVFVPGIAVSNDDIKQSKIDLSYIPTKTELRETFVPHKEFVPNDKIGVDKTVDVVTKNEQAVVVEERRNEVVVFDEQREDYMVIGQLFNTYILAEGNGSMILVDQHAAHERLNFERLLKALKEDDAPSQSMLIPEIINVTASEFASFTENMEFVNKIGFDATEFGHNTIKISMVPAPLAEAGAGETLLEILGGLSKNRGKTTEKQEMALYTVACKASLKAGRHLSKTEMENLLENALRLDADPTCPHGRPIILKITKSQIEKQFKRIV